jgi:hypothetical protein
LQLPYLIFSSVIFVIPYFFIVGFDKDGVADKFFWYWLFQGLYMSTMVFLGHLLACALPNPATSNGNELRVVVVVVSSAYVTHCCRAGNCYSARGHVFHVHLAVLRLHDQVGGLPQLLDLHVLA